jgi:4-hydroxymandelate synthase
MSTALTSVSIDHVEFYVQDAAASAADLMRQYDFAELARSRAGDSIAVGQADVALVLTRGSTDDHPASAYVQAHGDGVANIALRTTDARAAWAEAVAGGARSLGEPTAHNGCVTATIAAFGDVAHTFVQRADGHEADRYPPALIRVADAPARTPAGLSRLDHFAVCLPAGELESTVKFYASALSFTKIFEERIVVGDQAMNSEVVQSASGAVTLTLIEPDTSRDPGQIDEFVKAHGGPGVQHVAITSDDIVRSVMALREHGVTFLDTPDAYYGQLPERLALAAHDVDELRELDILADRDDDGQLFQIFTQSTHPRGTFFFEVIERLGASTFGSGNIKALYEAVERTR